jgi:hypothetical protein
LAVYLVSFSIQVQSAFAATDDQAELNGSDAKPPLPQPLLTKKDGIVLFDYETIPVPNIKPLDLLGFHYLDRFTDWLYIGLGGYTSLVQGDYGGFMVFDATLQLQKKVIGDLFVDAGIGLGAGGGGKDGRHSAVLTGDGGFFKGYAGLGYDFNLLAAGINYSKVTFSDSAIDQAQFDLFVQVPTSYFIGPYEYSSHTLTPQEQTALSVPSGENVLSFSLDNLIQINPTGQNRSRINLLDIQYSRYFSDHAYTYFSMGVGYQGLPLYNQVLGGVGYKLTMLPQVIFAGQLGVGSGGFAPQLIDTGSGLLVYPKLSAEYLFNKSLGSAFTFGYLFAPLGTSKNMTLGASLNYHLALDDGAVNDLTFRGFRVNLFQQTEVNVKAFGKDLHDLTMVGVQLDQLVSDHFYAPIQVSVAYNDFRGFPAYGEILVGLGLQSKVSPGDRFQTFAQLLVGGNVPGVIAKLQLGVNYSLNDHYALYVQVGRASTVGIGNRYDFSANSVGLGLSYRFSVPSR